MLDLSTKNKDLKISTSFKILMISKKKKKEITFQI